MTYQAEIEFFKKALSHYRINAHVIKNTFKDFPEIDRGIRKYLGLEDIYAKTVNLMETHLKPNTIFFISDDFFSHYILLELPDNPEIYYLIIGPYTDQNFTKEDFLAVIEKYKLPASLTERLIQYFMNLPFLNDTEAFHILLGTFAETIWDSDNYKIEQIHHAFSYSYFGTVPSEVLLSITESKDISFKMKLLEDRYHLENSLITYVSQGNYARAKAAAESFSHLLIENRAHSQLRDYKNYLIITNTLMRKAAEAGGVHPIHIDKLSAAFARKIETFHTLEQATALFHEMLRKYCLLVKNNSIKDYSYFVQRVITRIESDLTADQSLKTHAAILNVSSSYLSSLFRKETGMTLTEYANQKRIEHGIFLLNSTKLQIQTIAELCGLSDINYFSKLFKKQIGVTPTEYRKSLL